MVAAEVERMRSELRGFPDPSRLLASFIAASPWAVALYGNDGRRVLANRRFDELFGSELPASVDVRCDTTLTSLGMVFWLRRAFEGEPVSTPTFWFEPREGQASEFRRRLAISAQALPVVDDGGAVQFVLTTFSDQTAATLLDERRRDEMDELRRLFDERRRLDHERRANADQFRAIFDQCSDGVMITGDDGGILDINPAGCEIVGRPREALLGVPFWRNIENSPEARAHSETLVREGRLAASVRIERADGVARDLEIRSVANFLPGRHLTTFRDVTERLRTERALEESRQHLVASQRIGHVGSWELDLHSFDDLARNTLRGTDECYRIFGFEPGSIDLTPERFLAMVHPEDRTPLLRSMSESIRTSTVYWSEHRIRRADGEERILHSRAELVPADDHGRPPRLIGTSQDVTERTMARRRIQQLNEELERRVAERTADLASANRDLEAFSYSVSHDLRAPLRAIAGYARLVVDEQARELDDEARHALERIATSTRRMEALIDDLLAFARSGREPLELVDVSSRSVLDEALEEVGLPYLTRGDGEAPELTIGDLPVCRADPGLLRQVFANLLSNALKFSSGRNPARIEVTASDSGGETVWSVRDNGIGFDMQHARDVFEVFRRLPSARGHEGSGVGLALVERIVQRHGGRVWAEGSEGHGATFHFTLAG